MRPAEGGDEIRAWDGLAVAVAPGRALLGPEAARLVVRALEFYASREGLRLSPQADHVRRVLRFAASHAEGGHADTTVDPAAEPSGTWITTTQVAGRLGYSPRHCSRLAASGAFGEARSVKGRWMVQREEVDAWLAQTR